MRFSIQQNIFQRFVRSGPALLALGLLVGVAARLPAQVVSFTGVQTTVGNGFSGPFGVAVDGAGNVFVADTYNNRVVKVQQNLHFGNVDLDTSTTLTLEYNIDANTTLGTPRVLTDGAPNQDFTLASGSTCSGSKIAGSHCEVNVTFTPHFAGLRRGAVQIVDNSGKVLATDYMQGTGVGPQIAFESSKQTLVGSGFSQPSGVSVDGAGNVLVADTGNNRVMKIALDGTPTPVGSSFSQPSGVAVDGAGNVLVADTGNNRVVKLPFGQPLGLSFAATAVGSTSSDSPQSFTVENIGNALLSGSGLTVSTNFAQVPGSGTPPDCSASFSLTPGGSCQVSVSFTPTQSGLFTGTVTLTDNALNVNPATQVVKLYGTGQLVAQTITFTPPVSPQTEGTTVKLSTTASSGLPVRFMSSTTRVCKVSGTTATLLTAGTCSIQAIQDGNTQYARATPVTQSFTVK